MRLQKKLRAPNLTTAEKSEIDHRITDINTDIQTMYDRDLKEAEERVARQVKTDPKAFFKYANSKRATRTRIGPLKYTSNSGNITYKSGPKEMADILSNQYNKEPLQPHELPPTNPSHPIKLEDIDINRDDIIKAISSISNSSAPGPDGVTPKLLKEYLAELAEPLSTVQTFTRHW